MSKLTKKEVQVLYQLNAKIYNPIRIAAILAGYAVPSVRKDVQKTMHTLARKKLITVLEKGGRIIKKAKITKSGKDNLKKHHRLVFG